eukprot:scaffold31738_cov26-Tisochrysis_lutea.AAC.3
MKKRSWRRSWTYMSRARACEKLSTSDRRPPRARAFSAQACTHLPYASSQPLLSLSKKGSLDLVELFGNRQTQPLVCSQVEFVAASASHCNKLGGGHVARADLDT